MVEIEAIVITAIFTTIVGVATVALAIITGLYVKETRLIRKAGQNPSFSLEPSLYALGGRFYFLYLVNTGQTASDIRLNCWWGSASKRFYILSLGNQARAFLNGIPIAEIVERKQKLSADITCKDARNETYNTKMEVDFSNMLDDNTIVSYQFNYLGNIVDKLEDIRKRLDLINLSLTKSIRSVRPVLSISIKLSKNPVIIGEEQNVVVTVTDTRTDERVLGAIINYRLVSPIGSRRDYSGDLTDENGNFTFPFTMNEIYEVGKYQLIVWANRKEYQPDAVQTTFTAVPKTLVGDV
jgi:hypothetical protein